MNVGGGKAPVIIRVEVISKRCFGHVGHNSKPLEKEPLGLTEILQKNLDPGKQVQEA